MRKPKRKCSGCGRDFLLDELKYEKEELWRGNPGIRVNGVGSPYSIVKVKSHNIFLCKRCQILRKISGFISLISACLFGWLLYHLTSTIGKELGVLWFLLWVSGSFLWAGLLIGRLFQVITRCDTKWTGNKTDDPHYDN